MGASLGWMVVPGCQVACRLVVTKAVVDKADWEMVSCEIAPCRRTHKESLLEAFTILYVCILYHQAVNPVRKAI